MFNLIVAASVIFATTSASSASTPEDVQITEDARWALLSGLENRLRGKFIITGLNKAEQDCAIQKSCATAASVALDTHAVSLPATRLTVYGKPVVAFVSVLSARRSTQNIDVLLSIFDPKTGRAERNWAKIGIDNDGATPELRRLVTVH
jgi:hypothetical protein